MYLIAAILGIATSQFKMCVQMTEISKVSRSKVICSNTMMA